MAKCTYGIDNFIAKIAGGKPPGAIGLVSNSSAITSSGAINLDALHAAGASIGCIFSPEHGYFANVRDGDHIADGAHPDNDLSIYSLFTADQARNAIVENAAKHGIELILFDIQDVGVRFYTYIHALGYALAASEKLGIPIVVADRPNPVSCSMAEGNIPDSQYPSELCPYLIPARYGMTIGELAKYLAATAFKGARLTVEPVDGYDGRMYFGETGLPWKKPSPAMASPDTAFFYPGTCFFEGTTLSEGRGTDAPFQTIGAPFVDPGRTAAAAAKALADNAIEGYIVSAARFVPRSSKHDGKECGGIRVSRDRDGIRTLEAGLHILKALYDEYRSDGFEFVVSPVSKAHFIDRLAGTSSLRETIVNGTQRDLAALFEKWRTRSREFATNAADSYIYRR